MEVSREATPALTPVVESRRRTSIGRRLLRRRGALIGLCGLTLVVTVAVFAPLIAPHDPLQQNLSNTLAPPVWNGGTVHHILGTDSLGRDILSRLIYGARDSLLISISAALLGATLGLITGSIAGYSGGATDSVIMRLGDIQLAFPFILLAIVVLGVIANRTPLDLILVLGLPSWIIYARVVRSRVIAERRKDYVLAARSLGTRHARVLVRYVIPSVWQVVPVIVMLDIGFLIILESTLSFLGFGLTPPTPSWGSILADGRQYMIVSPWMPIFAGLAIMFTVLSVNLVADGMADILDPKITRATFRREILRLPRPRLAEPEPEPDDNLLVVRDLEVQFPFDDRTVSAVRGVSFSLRPGEAVGVVGESGSGKSVTALALIQLLDAPGRVSGGEILFEGKDLARIDDGAMSRLRGRRISMIFQNPSAALNPVLTIGYQMAETLKTQGTTTRRDGQATAVEALRTVGIGDPERVMRRYPFELSGGMNQRVMIAMAMANRPALLIADEPTTALDVTTQAQILEHLRTMTREASTTLVLISHDVELVSTYAGRVIVMYAGRICEDGPVESVIETPAHPYTQALLASLPGEDDDADRLTAIPGELPDPSDPPPGCAFAERCPLVLDICSRVDPDTVSVGDRHTSACHRATELVTGAVQA
jgi:peptide/nickel transport system permease protein